MIRLGALFWLLLVVSAGFVTFKVKYAVQDIEDELSRVRKQTVAEQQEIRVLNAEWTYLNQPERLAELNRRFLQLSPIGAKQLQQKVEDIPLRPLPPPSAAPDILVAQADPAPAAIPAPPTAAPAVRNSEPPSAAPASSPGAVSALAALAIGQASASELPATPAALKPASARSAVPVRLAKATAASPRSLDELFSQVAETR
jgi:hypothetical protein